MGLEANVRPDNLALWLDLQQWPSTPAACMHPEGRRAFTSQVCSPSAATLTSCPAACRHPGSFCCVRLLAGKQLDAAWPQLQLCLAQAVLHDPPYAMAWLRGFQHKEQLLRCMTDASVEAEQALGPAAMVALTKPEQLQQLLALRGLLGCDLLLHALQKRHLVEYGRWACRSVCGGNGAGGLRSWPHHFSADCLCLCSTDGCTPMPRFTTSCERLRYCTNTSACRFSHSSAASVTASTSLDRLYPRCPQVLQGPQAACSALPRR